jgi:hypothetical protein
MELRTTKLIESVFVAGGEMGTYACAHGECGDIQMS